MPKMKTHKGTKKRFRLSATGKAMHRSAGTSHLAANSSSKTRRKLRGTSATTKSESKRIARLLCGNGY
jgi:large subunit ribosomal protein L35